MKAIPTGFLLAGALLLASLLAAAPRALGGSATWLNSPVSNKWNSAANWLPANVPNGATDIATFSFSDTTTISVVQNTEVDSIFFAEGASSFTIMPRFSPDTALVLSGAGVVNNSGVVQHFAAGVAFNGSINTVGTIEFANAASAGEQTDYTVNGSNANATLVGAIIFRDTSTAGSATFLNLPNPSNVRPSRIDFEMAATAGNALVTSVGSTLPGGAGAQVYFYGTATAGNATFVCGGGGASGGYTESFVEFREGSTAGMATLTANGGTASGAPGGVIYFQSIDHQNPSTGTATLVANGGTNGGLGGQILLGGKVLGSGTVILHGNGCLDVSTASPVTEATIGSLAGEGFVHLGARELEVGTNNANTVFNGVIEDGGLIGGTGGALVKAGRGTWTVAGESLYTGGTTLKAGRIFLANSSGSATGNGPVTVTGGTLAGTGIIAGALTFAPGSTGATLAPGSGVRVPATLTIQRAMTLGAGTNFQVDLKPTGTPAADQVKVAGATIAGGVTLSLRETSRMAPPVGTVFTVIANTSALPTVGTFAGLGEGATIVINGQTFAISYQGGDGNDVTLTYLGS